MLHQGLPHQSQTRSPICYLVQPWWQGWPGALGGDYLGGDEEMFGQNKTRMRCGCSCMKGRKGSLLVVVFSDVSWHLDVKEAEQEAVCLAM